MFCSEFLSGWGVGCSTSRATDVSRSRWRSRGGEGTSDLGSDGRMLSRALMCSRSKPGQPRRWETCAWFGGEGCGVWGWGGGLLRGPAGAPCSLRARFPNKKWEVRAGGGGWRPGSRQWRRWSSVGGPESYNHAEHHRLHERLQPASSPTEGSAQIQFNNFIETQIFSVFHLGRQKTKKTPQKIKHPCC